MERKEALEVVRKNMPTDRSLPVYEALQTLIPELAESEDERTRKEIVEFIRSQIEDGNSVGWDRWIAYLEKQKESLHISETCKENADSFTEEVKRYYSDNFEYLSSNQPTLSILTNIARHFAEWQKKQDLAEMAQSKSPLSVAYANRCFENGKQAMKEQMLKDAEECELYWVGAFLAIDLNMAALGYSEKDKIKVIVLKEKE